MADVTFDPQAIQEVMNSAKNKVVQGAVVETVDPTSLQLSTMDDIEAALAPTQLPPKRRLPALPNKGMTIKFVNLMLPFVENFWVQRKRYPTTEEFMTEFGISRDEVIFINTQQMWLKCLDRRGIRRPNVDENFLSPRQQAAISLVSNFHDKRPKDIKLAAIGCSLEEYNGWLNDPTFKSALSARSDEILNHVGVDANIGLANLIQKEDFRAIKFYFEITGQAASPEAINVKQTLQVIIEAVQKHVKDPSVLQAIAEEVNSIRAIQGVQ